MAARWNSSRAPESPLSRIRSKPWCVFKCAKRISTRFRSSRDLANAFVFIFRRAVSRASSWISRGILRASAVVQHFARIGHTLAVPLGGAVQQGTSVAHGAAGLKQFPRMLDPQRPVLVE